MRFLYSSIGFSLAILGSISSNLAAVAAPIRPTTTSHIARMVVSEGDLTLIKGNGVEFTLPAGFAGGSPSNAETKNMVAETTKIIPSMASFANVVNNNPTMLKAIALSTNPQQNPSMVLVTRLPIPANVSLDYVRQVMAKYMPSVLPPEFKLVNNQIANIGSRQIVKMGIDVNVQGVKLQESIGLLKEGNVFYQVTYVYTTENAGKSAAIFEQIVNTFKTTPVTAKRQPML